MIAPPPRARKPSSVRWAATMTPDELKALLARLGWSNYRLAKELGVSATTVGNWVSGRYPISRLATLAIYKLVETPSKIA